MEDAFLADNLVMYIEKEIVQEFDTDSVIDYFKIWKLVEQNFRSLF